MPKRSTIDIDLLNRILDEAPTGLVLELESEKHAINLRQRIYNYRNTVLKGTDEELKKKVNQISIAVVDKTVEIGVVDLGYWNSIGGMLNGKDK